jgi:hypothetical protein
LWSHTIVPVTKQKTCTDFPELSYGSLNNNEEHSTRLSQGIPPEKVGGWRGNIKKEIVNHREGGGGSFMETPKALSDVTSTFLRTWELFIR